MFSSQGSQGPCGYLVKNINVILDSVTESCYLYLNYFPFSPGHTFATTFEYSFNWRMWPWSWVLAAVKCADVMCTIHHAWSIKHAHVWLFIPCIHLTTEWKNYWGLQRMKESEYLNHWVEWSPSWSALDCSKVKK